MRKTISISNEVNKWIEKEAKKQQITQSQILEIIIRNYFKGINEEKEKQNDK